MWVEIIKINFSFKSVKQINLPYNNKELIKLSTNYGLQGINDSLDS